MLKLLKALIPKRKPKTVRIVVAFEDSDYGAIVEENARKWNKTPQGKIRPMSDADVQRSMARGKQRHFNK